MRASSRFPREIAIRLLGLSLLLTACATTGPSLGESPLMRECDAQVRAELHLTDTPVQTAEGPSQVARTARLVGGSAVLALETVTGPVLSLPPPVGGAIGLGANLATIQGAKTTADVLSAPAGENPPAAVEGTTVPTADSAPADRITAFSEADMALRMRYYDLVDTCVRARERSTAAAAGTPPGVTPQ